MFRDVTILPTAEVMAGYRIWGKIDWVPDYTAVRGFEFEVCTPEPDTYRTSIVSAPPPKAMTSIKQAHWYLHHMLDHVRRTGMFPNFQDYVAPDTALACSDPRVLAVREDTRVGNGSCSAIDECMTDEELYMDLDRLGCITPEEAVAAMHRRADLLDELQHAHDNEARLGM
jgi:hypothetical protein